VSVKCDNVSVLVLQAGMLAVDRTANVLVYLFRKTNSELLCGHTAVYTRHMMIHYLFFFCLIFFNFHTK